MTFPNLHSLMTTARQIGANVRDFGQLVAKGGWRDMFTRGGDLSGLSGGARCPNPARQSAWVFACQQIIAGTVRSVPLKFETIGKKGERKPFADAETDAFWRAPSETASGPLRFGSFIELSLAWMNIAGQACWILDDTWLTPRGVKSPILLARPDRLSPIKKGDTLLGWLFTDGLGGRHTLVPQQVVRPRFLNPYDDAAGLSPLEAARMAVDADYAAGVFARNVAASNGDQGVYIVAKGGGMLSTEQREQIIAALRQKAEMSKRGEYRPAFLTADVSVEDPKIKAVDAAFNQGRAMSRNEIYNAFGVPPSMAEVTASYSIGSASDRFRLIEQTCMPHSVRLCEEIALIERLRSGRILEASLDWAQHPVMAAVRAERGKVAVDMWKCGVPWKVLSQNHDLGLSDFPGWDEAWLPLNVERVEPNHKHENEKETEADKQDDSGDAKKALEAAGAAFKNLRLLISSPDFVKEVKGQAGQDSNSLLPAPCCSHKAEDPALDPARVKLWQAHMQARKPSEKLFLGKIRRVLMEARRETLANLDTSEKALEGVRTRGVLDILFDLQKFSLSMVEETAKAHKETLEQSLMQFATEIGSDDPWKIESHAVLNFTRNRENRIRDCSREIHDEIKAAIEQGLAAGESNKQLADRIRAAFNGLADDRADMIAATEVTAAYGFARHDAMQGLGIENKEWLSAQDHRVRDTHKKADGQTVAMDEPFIIELKDGGTEELMHPGDPNGSAENVIRCRCVEIAKMEEK